MSQECDNDVLDLVKKKGFYPFEYMNDFEKIKEKLPNKEKFYSSLTGKKVNNKEYDHVLKVWNNEILKNVEILSRFVFKMCRFIIS